MPEQKQNRTRRKSYVVQEQAALNDAATAIERGLANFQIKLIQQRLETLRVPAEEERQQRFKALVEENAELKRRLAADNQTAQQVRSFDEIAKKAKEAHDAKPPRQN